MIFVVQGMLMKKLITITTLLLFACITNAQQKQTKITGTLKDSANQKAIAYATVSLYKDTDPATPVKSTYTNEKGKFELKADTGSYTIVFSHTGYSDIERPITVGNDELQFNDVSLGVSTGTLSGVTVRSKKPLIEQADDKIIFNVENDPTTKTETAIDILRKTPFVSVDGDNNIQVNGQTNFKVLLNGRETSMFAQNVKEALKGFPGAMITRIEVITSPSAKYDAEGVGGIINIITKKKVAGYNGSINMHYSTTKWMNLNTNLSAKFGKLGISLNYGAGGGNNIKGTAFNQTIPNNPSYFSKRTLLGSRLSSNFWNFGNAEVSYELDSLTTISAYGNVSGGNNKSRLNQVITTEFPSSPTIGSFYYLRNRYEYPTKSVGTDYIRKFKTPEKEFSIRLNGEFGKSNSFLDSEQDNPVEDRFIINNSLALNNQYTIQTDYIHPLSKNQKIEGGLKTILRRASSDFESFLKYDKSHDYVLNPANTNSFDYHQDIYSAYGTYSFKVKGTTFRLGARLEHTVVDGDFSSSNTKVEQRYTNVLPNIQSTTKFSNVYTMVLGYNMRLQRPGIWNLNPFVNNNDSLNIFFGNPQLGPQTIHSVSMQSRIMMGTTFAGLTLTGSYSDNMIVQFATFDPTTGITRTTSGNVGKEIQVSLNGNLSAKITPEWNVFLNGNVRYNHVRNKMNASQTNSGVGGNANLNTTYQFNKRFTASGYAGFWRGPVTIQTRYPLNIWYGLGFGYKMFKEKFTVTLNASNFFQKYRDYKMVTRDPAFTTTSISTMPFGGAALSLSWNFGKLTENVSKKKGVTNDDLLGNGGSSNRP